jgi:hypothetical protein
MSWLPSLALANPTRVKRKQAAVAPTLRHHGMGLSWMLQLVE